MSHPLGPSLALAVPLEIARLQRQGGPSADDVRRARAAGEQIAERGDVLLYGGAKGEATALFVQLVRALAVLAFRPGGVSTVDLHWEATAPQH